MRRLVLLIALAALAAGSWMVFGAGATELAPIGTESDQAGQEIDSSVELDAEPFTKEKEVATEDANAARSQLELSEASAKKDSDELRVLVVNKDSGEAIPGATVSYQDYSQIKYNEMTPEEREEYQVLSLDMEKLTAHFGTTVQADSRGMVSIPSENETYFQVTGRQDDLFGQLGISRDLLDKDAKRDFKLELERDLSLQVQVLDHLGKPAVGVPLNCQPKGVVSNMYFQGQMGKTEGPNGMARIPHLQISRLAWKMQGEDATEYVLRAFIPGLTDGGESFDILDPPEEPLVLKLPPTGKLIVQTVDPEGMPLHTGYNNVQICLAEGEEPGRLKNYRNVSNPQWTEANQGKGKWTFERVVTGKTFLASVYMVSEYVQEVFHGPAGPGTEVTLRLSPKNVGYSIVGRILDASLEPQARKQFRVEYSTQKQRSGSNYFFTDGDGRFYLSVGREGQGDSLEKLTVIPQGSGQSTEKAAAMYRLPGSFPLVLGKNELGDLVLEASPLAASGRLRVDGEVPDIEKFALQVERLHPPRSSRQAREDWQPEQGTVFEYSEGGRFEIHGSPEPGRLRISMQFYSAPGSGGRLDFLPMDPVEFTLGSEGITINLETGGTLRASVLVDEGIPIQQLFLQLVLRNGAELTEDSDPRYSMQLPYGQRFYGHYRGPEEDAQGFRWGTVQPGEYRLDVKPRGARKPVVSIDNIVISKGERLDDPRLERIDLRGVLRRIKISLQDAEGGRLKQENWGPPMVVINDPNPEAVLHAYAANNSVSILLTAEPSLDLLILSRDYQSTEVFGVREDRVVVMEPFPSVRLKLAGGRPDAIKDLIIRASLNQKDRKRDRRKLSSDYGMSGSIDNWTQPMSGMQAFDAEGEVTLPVPGDGTYSINLYLQGGANRSGAGVGVQPAEIEVRSSSGRELVYEIAIEAEDLQKAIDAVKEQSK